MSDIREDLGEGYYYQNGGWMPKSVVYSGKKNNDSLIIFPAILSYLFDQHFVLIRQQDNRHYHVYDLSTKLEDMARAFRHFDSTGIGVVDSSSIKLFNENIENSVFYRKINSNTTAFNSEKDQSYFYSLADSIAQIDLKFSGFVDDKINYWIIDKTNHCVYGPYEEEGFNLKRTRLHISKKLQL